MKKALIISLLLLCLAPMRAQTDSLLVPKVADTAYSEDDYQAPNINPIYYFGSPFCEHFAEGKVFAGIDDYGLGFNYTYLPEVWGGHLTGYVLNTLWVMVGPDYRLSKPWQTIDWHVYGSAGVFYDGDFAIWHPAMEVGVRAGSGVNDGKFCFNSGTLGLMTNFEGIYVTLGLSLTISALMTLLLLL
ncbi:MAG: hypothetical protein J5641_05970 [Bacteroidales bacterium]|nr:hypothetical protein [Bacteroidales bacterium]